MVRGFLVPISNLNFFKIISLVNESESQSAEKKDRKYSFRTFFTVLFTGPATRSGFRFLTPFFENIKKRDSPFDKNGKLFRTSRSSHEPDCISKEMCNKIKTSKTFAHQRGAHGRRTSVTQLTA